MGAKGYVGPPLILLGGPGLSAPLPPTPYAYPHRQKKDNPQKKKTENLKNAKISGFMNQVNQFMLSGLFYPYILDGFIHNLGVPDIFHLFL